jgi:hypothetical protein
MGIILILKNTNNENLCYGIEKKSTPQRLYLFLDVDDRMLQLFSKIL